MGLLWSSHSREIGRTGLTISDFVDAAISLAREEGIGALSIRNVASRLGVRAMAMYSAVPGKSDLVALMVDKAYRDLYAEGDEPDTTDWRKGLREIASANRALYARHEWLHALTPVRSAMGPYEARKHEIELRVIDRIGLTDFEMDQALTLVVTHVAQACRMESQLRRERMDTGLDDDEWWVQAMPVLERVYDPERFPLCVRVGTAASAARNGQFWGQEIFEFGLERIIDGIGALISNRGAMENP
ncbi:TetR/AcrR family transcriptional regulator C-terminal domain-containing protein [Chelativorans sp.]|uniref:TetR/AcrR family transcriptional regulator C-terminal domain-containing protein n=1 Tax=Chelativorans sp. TaxID=2203393 RepID=UPI0028116F7F|nr:TetR/AcrR family transcriptional regulator C-terminal domain-containing protein [Chelativorans sp.]